MDKQTILNNLKERFTNKKVLVLGLGREGQASLNFLLQNCAALNLKDLAIADVNEKSCLNSQKLALEQYKRQLKAYSGEKYLEAIPNYDLVLKSPGISFKNLEYLEIGVNLANEAKAASTSYAKDFSSQAKLPRLAQAPDTEITCQVDLFLQIYGTQTVAVSGTKGKSTTTTLISELLNASVGKAKLLGNIGIAAFNELFTLGEQKAALELSCHQLEFTKHSSSVALLTNFYEEHLDHYHDLAEYYQAKLNLLRFGTKGQIVILPAYEATLLNLALGELKKGQRVFFLCRNKDELVNLQAIYKIRQIKADAYAFSYELKTHELRYLGELLKADYQESKLMQVSCEAASSLPSLQLSFSKQLVIEHLQLDSVLAILATFAYYLREIEQAQMPYLKHSTLAIAKCVVDPLALQARDGELTQAWTSFISKESTHLNDCLLNFHGLEHRLQYVGTYKSHPVYNDSICTIPLAAIKALEALPNCQTIILGGLDRGLDYSALEAYLSDKALNVIGIKDTGWQLISQLEKQQSKLHLYKVASMQEAVQIAYQVTLPERGILLSPAAASYNTYKDFAERGFDFVKEIEAQAER